MLTIPEMLELARKAGFTVGHDAGGSYVAPKYTDSVGTVQRLVQAAYAAGQADEREACAKLIENQRYAVLQNFRTYTAEELVQSLKSDAKTLAILIRARGKKEGV